MPVACGAEAADNDDDEDDDEEDDDEEEAAAPLDSFFWKKNFGILFSRAGAKNPIFADSWVCVGCPPAHENQIQQKPFS